MISAQQLGAETCVICLYSHAATVKYSSTAVTVYLLLHIVQASASSEATANHQLNVPSQSAATNMDTEQKLTDQTACVTAKQEDPQTQSLLETMSDADEHMQRKQEQDLQPKLEADDDSQAAMPAAISAAEAAKTRRARQRKPTFDEQQAALLESYAPTRRRASTKAAALLRDQALAEFTDSDYIMEDELPKSKRKGKGLGGKLDSAATLAAALEATPEPEKMDVLLGCTKCRYLKKGCGACRDKPSLERPASLRWKPDAGKQQKVTCLSSQAPGVIQQYKAVHYA